jgi:exosortase K
VSRALAVTAQLLRAARDAGPVALAMLAGAYALKLGYSTAGARELGWVLAPSCYVARSLGVTLAYELGAGWISHAPRMVVGPACAGVNFLIVAWLALYFGAQARCRGRLHKLGWLAASFALAYLATLLSNGVRIALAAQLYAAELHWGYLDAARVHRLLGVVLYCSTLLGLCRGAERMLSPDLPLPASRLRLAPFYWYAAVVVGVPLANRAFLRDPRLFAEHAVLSLGVGFAVVWLWQRLPSRVLRLCSDRARA